MRREIACIDSSYWKFDMKVKINRNMQKLDINSRKEF